MGKWYAFSLTIFAFFLTSSMIVASDAESIDDLQAKLGLQIFQKDVAAPDFELESLGGVKTSLRTFRGSVVFLNFWATWCPPCRAEMPAMQKLYDRFKPDGLIVLAVDLQEGKDKVGKFMKKYNLNFPVVLDVSGRVAQEYGIRSIPTTYIVDREGYVLAGAFGGREWDSVESFEYFARILDSAEHLSD